MKSTIHKRFEFTIAELNHILMRHLQQTYKVKIEEVSRKDGLVTMQGEESTDNAVLSNGIESDLIHSIIPSANGTGTGKKKREWKNRGITDYIREEFKNGEKLTLEMLFNRVNTGGFEEKKAMLRTRLKSNLSREITEVSENVFQLTTAYEKKNNNVTH